MNILMLGDCAFVGKNLCKGLIEAGHHCELIHENTLTKLREYDIIHIHYPYHFWKIWPVLRIKHKAVVLHWHGDDARLWYRRLWLKTFFLGIAKANIVSTPDLLKHVPNSTVVTSPVDTDLFKPLPAKLCGTIVLKKRGKYNSLYVRHSAMPRLLNHFDMADVDEPRKSVVKELGVFQTEALACGLTVWHHWDKDRKWVLENASIPVATEKLLKVYEEALK